MKKILITLTVFISLNGYSQLYGVAGLNLANVTSNAQGVVEENSTLPSINAGLLYRFDLFDNFDLETGLYLTGKGSKTTTYLDPLQTSYLTSTFNPLYIEIPVNLVFKLVGNTKKGIFASVGPYLGIGIGGKSKLHSKILGIESNSEKNIEFNNDDILTTIQEDASFNKLKRFDMGANIGIGVDANKFMLKANYGLGLAKISSTESANNTDEKNKHRVFSITIGFKLSN